MSDGFANMQPQLKFLSSSISSRLYPNSEKSINLPSIKMNFSKQYAAKIPQSDSSDSGSFSLAGALSEICSTGNSTSYDPPTFISKVSQQLERCLLSLVEIGFISDGFF